ncbi:DUF2752 domain-containing protein [Myxacorys almedinensis]|uniref:DUF2752 domain-containing protein n=1 Tax=Myxacorys almedinensis A TaxID=2690445 RepID=A0A8J8CGN3_9CYAN|nr:DUF2752 domain-containing protein [Myxacorys almedinensis]NDJ15769.1 DUF2752 domain-containing protein [Myxacorys almedinensis A]
MPLSQRHRVKRYFYLAIALVPLIGSLTLKSGIPFLGCPLKYWVGIPCPAWGLTRAFIAIAHGHLNQAATYHLFAPALFLAFLILIIHLLLELALNKSLKPRYITLFHQSNVQIFLLLLLFGYHGSRVYQLTKIGTLQSDILGSPFGRAMFH